MVLLLVLVCSLAFAQGASEGKTAGVVKLTMADNQPDGTPNVEGDKKFVELVSKYSDGSIEITLHKNGVLGSELDCADMLQAGTLDLCRMGAGLNPAVEELSVFSMPYIFSSMEQLCANLEGELGQTVSKAITDKTGIQNLGFFVSAPRSFYTNKTPIRSLADMKGLKIRVQDDPTQIALAKAVGAYPTPMNYAEVYSSLETGVIDGAENDFASYFSAGHYEVAKFYSLDMHTMGPSTLLMSEKAWKGLSAEQQEIMKKAAYEAYLFEKDFCVKFANEARKKVEAGGATVIDLDLAEFQNACKSVYAQYPQFATLLGMIK